MLQRGVIKLTSSCTPLDLMSACKGKDQKSSGTLSRIPTKVGTSFDTVVHRDSGFCRACLDWTDQFLNAV